MIVIAVDPGLDGAIAGIDADTMQLEYLVDMPTFTVKEGHSVKRKVDADALAIAIDIMRPGHAFVERVGAMSGQGVSSMFNFGFSAGMIRGILAAQHVRVDYLTPQKWQKLVKAGGGKDRSRARAAALFPTSAPMFARKKDDGRADAALIAYAGILTLDLL